MRPVAFGVAATPPLAAGENEGLAVVVPAPPQAAMTAVAPASFRNVRRSSSGVMLPNPPTRSVRESIRAWSRALSIGADGAPGDDGRRRLGGGAGEPRGDACARHRTAAAPREGARGRARARARAAHEGWQAAATRSGRAAARPGYRVPRALAARGVRDV